jgi:hypothetical protein
MSGKAKLTDQCHTPEYVNHLVNSAFKLLTLCGLVVCYQIPCSFVVCND